MISGIAISNRRLVERLSVTSATAGRLYRSSTSTSRSHLCEDKIRTPLFPHITQSTHRLFMHLCIRRNLWINGENDATMLANVKSFSFHLNPVELCWSCLLSKN